MSSYATHCVALACRLSDPALCLVALILGIISATLSCSTHEPDLPSSSGEFVIAYTGADRGVLQPCGCTKGMLGGIGRRAALLQAIAPSRHNALILATGGLIDGTSGMRDQIDSKTITHLDRLRYETLLVALGEMGYAAAALGPEELRLGFDRLREASEIVDFPFLLTNAIMESEEPLPFEKVCRISLNPDGRSEPVDVALFGVIALSLASELPDGVDLAPAGAAVLAAVEESGRAADFHVVLLSGSRADARGLSQKIPSPWLIVYSSPDSEPQIYEFGKQTGDGRIVTPGDRGRFVGFSTIVTRGDGRWAVGESRFEALDDSLPESDIVRFPIEIYRERIRLEKVIENQLATIPNRSGRAYRGSASCTSCHPETYKIWMESRHAQAWATLVQAERDYDPGCVSCHVTGYAIEKGFAGADAPRPLVDVGCEACHGPAGDHVEEGDPPTTIASCAACHDRHHSPGFDREEAWKKIACIKEH